MPELPEVEITRSYLASLLCGRRVLGFWTDWPRGLKATNDSGRTADEKFVAADISGRRVLGVDRRGKVLFFRFSGAPARIMAVHLRMSGRLEIVVANRPRPVGKRTRPLVPVNPGASERWAHFRWSLGRAPSGRDEAAEMRFIDPRKFGRVWYGSPASVRRDPHIGTLGVDAKSLSSKAFTSVMRGRRGMIKPLILRQDIVAGIGNIIADESLWRARIHPESCAGDLKERDFLRLGAAIGSTIHSVLSSGGTSLRDWSRPDGSAGGYQKRRLVYGRAGKPCPRCRTELERIVVAGRGTTLCPKCQKP